MGKENKISTYKNAVYSGTEHRYCLPNLWIKHHWLLFRISISLVKILSFTQFDVFIPHRLSPTPFPLWGMHRLTMDVNSPFRVSITQLRFNKSDLFHFVHFEIRKWQTKIVDPKDVSVWNSFRKAPEISFQDCVIADPSYLFFFGTEKLLGKSRGKLVMPSKSDLTETELFWVGFGGKSILVFSFLQVDTLCITVLLTSLGRIY